MPIIVKPFLQQQAESRGQVWDREAYAAHYAEGQAAIAALAARTNGCNVVRSIGGADIRERLEAQGPLFEERTLAPRHTPRGVVYYGPAGVRQAARDRKRQAEDVAEYHSPAKLYD